MDRVAAELVAGRRRVGLLTDPDDDPCGVVVRNGVVADSRVDALDPDAVPGVRRHAVAVDRCPDRHTRPVLLDVDPGLRNGQTCAGDGVEIRPCVRDVPVVMDAVVPEHVAVARVDHDPDRVVQDVVVLDDDVARRLLGFRPRLLGAGERDPAVAAPDAVVADDAADDISADSHDGAIHADSRLGLLVVDVPAVEIEPLDPEVARGHVEPGEAHVRGVSAGTDEAHDRLVEIEETFVVVARRDVDRHARLGDGEGVADRGERIRADRGRGASSVRIGSGGDARPVVVDVERGAAGHLHALGEGRGRRRACVSRVRDHERTRRRRGIEHDGEVLVVEERGRRGRRAEQRQRRVVAREAARSGEELDVLEDVRRSPGSALEHDETTRNNGGLEYRGVRPVAETAELGRGRVAVLVRDVGPAAVEGAHVVAVCEVRLPETVGVRRRERESGEGRALGQVHLDAALPRTEPLRDVGDGVELVEADRLERERLGDVALGGLQRHPLDEVEVCRAAIDVAIALGVDRQLELARVGDQRERAGLPVVEVDPVVRQRRAQELAPGRPRRLAFRVRRVGDRLVAVRVCHVRVAAHPADDVDDAVEGRAPGVRVVDGRRLRACRASVRREDDAHAARVRRRPGRLVVGGVEEVERQGEECEALRGGARRGRDLRARDEILEMQRGRHVGAAGRIRDDHASRGGSDRQGDLVVRRPPFELDPVADERATHDRAVGGCRGARQGRCCNQSEQYRAKRVHTRNFLTPHCSLPLSPRVPAH